MSSGPRAGILVIGAGIIGLATAYKLLRRHPGALVTVVEKESMVGAHQSGHNSGVMHAGLSYAPGSLKARLAAAGLRQMLSFCVEHAIPHEVCGKLVVAADESQVAPLRGLHTRGQANGLRGLVWLGAEELTGIEPHAVGAAGLLVPDEGIVDYRLVCAALVRCIHELGGRVLTSAALLSLRHGKGRWQAATAGGELEAGYLVNCAGLQCDRVAAMAGERPRIRIVPFRGDYFALRPERRHLVKHLIYPVPNPRFPFLGIHLHRRIDGRVEAGPNAVLALAREGYARGSINPRDAAAAMSFQGLWRFAARYPTMCWGELHRSHSRGAFAAALQRLVPALTSGDLVPGGSGVRAQAMAPDGTLIDDFSFLERPAALHVLNAPSPGATASLAIGGEIASRVLLATNGLAA